MLMGGALSRSYSFFLDLTHRLSERRLNKTNLKHLQKISGYQTQIFHQNRGNDELARLCDLHGSDKGEVRAADHPYSGPSHSYTDFYSRLFSHCKTSVTKVFECGIGTNNPNLASSMGLGGKPGASLRVWRDYFTNALVVGADIDLEILFFEERIKTHYVNQLEPSSIARMWAEVQLYNFDLMIDDGLHTFEAGSTLWLNSRHRLAPHGVYVIEDVPTSELIRYQDFFAAHDYAIDYVCLTRPNSELYDNNLVVIRNKQDSSKPLRA
jgi:hypothetical protein